MKFTNESTGEMTRQNYFISVIEQLGFSLGGAGECSLTTNAEKEFLAGTSPAEVAASWEGKFYSDDASAIFMYSSKYFGGGWKGGSIGVGMQLGFPYSRTSSVLDYKMVESFKEAYKFYKTRPPYRYIFNPSVGEQWQ